MRTPGWRKKVGSYNAGGSHGGRRREARHGDPGRRLLGGNAVGGQEDGAWGPVAQTNRLEAAS